MSPNPAYILSIDSIFFEKNKAQGIIFRGKRTGAMHVCTITVDHGNKYKESFRGGVGWYMMSIKDFISNINFKLNIGNGEKV